MSRASWIITGLAAAVVALVASMVIISSASAAPKPTPPPKVVPPVLVTQTISNQGGNVEPGGNGDAVATCPQNWKILGGGVASEPGATTIVYSVASGNGWGAGVHNPTDTTQPGAVAVAVCGQLQQP